MKRELSFLGSEKKETDNSLSCLVTKKREGG